MHRSHVLGYRSGPVREPFNLESLLFQRDRDWGKTDRAITGKRNYQRRDGPAAITITSGRWSCVAAAVDGVSLEGGIWDSDLD